MNIDDKFVLGKHLKALATAAKRYTLEEILTLSTATGNELEQVKIGSLSSGDFDYIFSDSISFTNAEIIYIFTDGSGSSPLAADDVNYIFQNGGTSTNSFTENEIGYIFS